jgi:hypothetical protein
MGENEARIVMSFLTTLSDNLINIFWDDKCDNLLSI